MIPVSPKACICWVIDVASAHACAWPCPRASSVEFPVALKGWITTWRP